jgi:hypothetical protein
VKIKKHQDGIIYFHHAPMGREARIEPQYATGTPDRDGLEQAATLVLDRMLALPIS